MKKVLIISLLVIATIIAVSVWVKNSETYKENPNTSQSYEERENNSDMESYFAKLEAKEKALKPHRFKAECWSCYPDSNWGPHPYQRLYGMKSGAL